MIEINKSKLSLEGKPYFIADIAANHDGSLERALMLIELAKESGADAAKFQNFKAERIVSKLEFDKLGKNSTHQKNWKKSVFEVYSDASINPSWTSVLKAKCDEVGIEYMSTPYDEDSLKLIDPYVNAIKIGSGDITWHDFLQKVAKKNKPIILSTGASTMDEVVAAVDSISQINSDIVLMQCNTNYTGSNDNFNYVNLNVLKKFREKYPDFVLGLSDHTPGHSTVLGAIALGARVIEKHFTDDTSRIGPDHSFSMDALSWREMVYRSMELYASLGNGEKVVEKNEIDSRLVQRRGTYLVIDKIRGEEIKEEDLDYLRPIAADGIPPNLAKTIVGRKVNRNTKSYTQILWSDIE
jgi:sialic acid synthase SpsE